MKIKNGFTLIELLVVIAIIGILSSVALASLNSARTKANVARKQEDFKNISTALYMFYDQYGRMPVNYNPCCGATEGSPTASGIYPYEKSMQELVDAKFLPTIPKSPDAQKYSYYDYGQGSKDSTTGIEIGVILATFLPSLPKSTTGISPSCRPWAPGVNWCSQNVNDYYCICVVY